MNILALVFRRKCPSEGATTLVIENSSTTTIKTNKYDWVDL